MDPLQTNPRPYASFQPNRRNSFREKRITEIAKYSSLGLWMGFFSLSCTSALAGVHDDVEGLLGGMCTTDHTTQCPWNEILCAFQCDLEISPVSIFDPLYLEN